MAGLGLGLFVITVLIFPNRTQCMNPELCVLEAAASFQGDGSKALLLSAIPEF